MLLKHHLPGVGENLLNPPEGVINWEASRPVPLETTQLWELRLFATIHPANTVYHPVDTCKMGAVDDETAVVDPQLRLRGLDNIRIADASIFPTMIGVNPNMTCFVIGERCAAFVSGQ